MRKKKKVYPGDVYEFLRVCDCPVPMKEIAKHFECCVGTIRRKVKELRIEGKKIHPTLKGLWLNEKIRKEEDAELMKKSMNWTVGSGIGLALIASIQKPLLIEAKKWLTTREDRQELKRLYLQLARLVDTVDIEEEFSPRQLAM